MTTPKTPVRKLTQPLPGPAESEATQTEHGLFKLDPNTIADALYTGAVNPMSPASGMRRLNFYINQAGKNISQDRHNVLEHAKILLARKMARAKDSARSAGRSANRKIAEA
jgi:hypothetical protein